MKKCERIALGHFLSDFPACKSFFEIIKMMESDSDEIVVWEPFENKPLEKVAQWIEDLSENLLCEYGE